MSERNCDNCSVCCKGVIPGEAYGHQFGPGTPCFFNDGHTCTIYSTRPTACANYLCGWRTDSTIPDELDPRVSNTLLLLTPSGDITAFVDSEESSYITSLEQLAVDRQVNIQVSFGEQLIKMIEGRTSG